MSETQHRAARRETLAADLAAVERLRGPALRERWAEVFGHPASPHLSQSLLRQSLAHRLQELALGGLRPALRKELYRLADDGDPSKPRPAPLSPGVRLVREWHGQHQVVDVVADGVVWQGTTYPSLSAVARAITGTRWSGPRFFGLHDDKTPRRPA
jgi:hypothetical protein